MATGVVGNGICRHRLPAPRHQFDDLAAADHEAALSAVRADSVRWKRLSATALVDWRIAGYTSTMTKNLWDEGGNSRDYDNPSPNPAMPLGQFRYASFAAGNISPYIETGTFVKLREVNLSFQAPQRWANLARARDLRVSLQARNLAMWTDYWSFDPEFNNFGNQNFNRFIDLAPYPSNKQFFFSLDLGY